MRQIDVSDKVIRNVLDLVHFLLWRGGDGLRFLFVANLRGRAGNHVIDSASGVDGDITITGSEINLRIEDDEITMAGTYMLRITANEGGNIRGLTPDPGWIKVE